MRLAAAAVAQGKQNFLQVIGVVKTANYQSLGEAPKRALPPLRQNYSDSMILYVKNRTRPFCHARRCPE